MPQRTLTITGVQTPGGLAVSAPMLTAEGIQAVAPYLVELFKAALAESQGKDALEEDYEHPKA